MKTMFSALFALLMFATPAGAVGCNVTQSTSEFIEMNRGGNLFKVFTDTLRQGNVTLKEADLQDRLTGMIQFRQTRADLPIDDPDRFTDPGGFLGEKLYWCDVDGNPTPGDPKLGTHMCAPGDCVIDNVELIGDVFSLTIRNSRDCSQDPSFPSCNP